jgi:hypothetical protein
LATALAAALALFLPVVKLASGLGREKKLEIAAVVKFVDVEYDISDWREPKHRSDFGEHVR